MKKEFDKTILDYGGELPDEVTIPDENIPPTHNQHIGTTSYQCMAYATAGIMRVLHRIWTGEDIKFSVAYIYGKYRKEANREGKPMFVSDLIPGLVNGGAVPFDMMPDLKEPEECFDYVVAHPELEEIAKPYADMFEGYVNLKDKTKLKTFENIKKALLKWGFLLYGEMVGHGVIFVKCKGDYVYYRDSDGSKNLKKLHYKDIKEAYAFIMADKEKKEDEKMNIIIEPDFFWNGTLQKRSKTDYIILHHRAGNGNVESIHDQHLNQGWAGIGYHFYIRKSGDIHKGRPINTIGAHTENLNSVSVGICFEGNYHDTDKAMPNAQLKAGQELIAYLKGIYPNAEIKGHRDFNATGCPGQYFPFDEITNFTIESEDEDMKIYNTVEECPTWARPYIERAKALGWIKGNEKGELNLDDNKIWTLVVMLRAHKIME